MDLAGAPSFGFDLGIGSASATFFVPGGTVLSSAPGRYTLVTRGPTSFTVSYRPGTPTRFGQTHGAPLQVGAAPNLLSISFLTPLRFVTHVDSWGGDRLGALFVEDVDWYGATISIPNTPDASGPKVELRLGRVASWYQVSAIDTVQAELEAFILDAIEGTPFSRPGFNLLATDSMSASIDALLARVGANVTRGATSLLDVVNAYRARASVVVRSAVEVHEGDKWCKIAPGTRLQIEADLDLPLAERDRLSIREIRLTVDTGRDDAPRRASSASSASSAPDLDRPGIYAGSGHDAFRINSFVVRPGIQAVFTENDVRQIDHSVGSGLALLFFTVVGMGVGGIAAQRSFRDIAAEELTAAFTEGLRQLFFLILPSLRQQMPWADFESALGYSAQVELR